MTFTEVSPKVTQEEGETIDLEKLIVSPFPDQTPRQILSREYEIGTFTVGSSFVSAMYAFPDALLDIDAVNRCVSMFRYFKAGVQIDVRSTTAIYHQGLMSISNWPSYNTSNTYKENVYRESAMSPVYLSFASQQSATTTMNWTSPLPYCDTTETEDTKWSSQIGTVIMSMVTPFRDIQSTGDFTVRVYAKFLNPHVAAPLPVTSVTRKDRLRMARHQSGSVTPSAKIDVESLVKTESNNMVSSARASPITPFLDVLGQGMNVISTLGKIVGLFDKPTSTASPALMTMETGRDMIQTNGLDLSTRLSMFPTSSLANSRVFGSNVTSQITFNELSRIPMLHHVDYLHQGTGSRTSFFNLNTSSRHGIFKLCGKPV